MSIQFLPSPAEHAWALEQLGLPESATPAEIDATFFRLLSSSQFVPYDEVQEAYEILKGRESSHGFRQSQLQTAEQQVDEFSTAIAKLKPAQKRLRYDALLKQLPADSRAAARLKAMTSAVVGAYQRFQFGDPVKQKLGDACVKALSLSPIDRLLLADEMRADKNFIMDQPRLLEAANSLREKQRGLTDSVDDFLRALFRSNEPMPAYQPPVSQPARNPYQIVNRAGMAPRNIPYRQPREIERTPLPLRLLVYAAIAFCVVWFLSLVFMSAEPKKPKFTIPRVPTYNPEFDYQPYQPDDLERLKRTQEIVERLRKMRENETPAEPPQDAPSTYGPPEYSPPESPVDGVRGPSDFDEFMRKQNEKLFGSSFDR